MLFWFKYDPGKGRMIYKLGKRIKFYPATKHGQTMILHMICRDVMDYMLYCFREGYNKDLLADSIAVIKNIDVHCAKVCVGDTLKRIRDSVLPILSVSSDTVNKERIFKDEILQAIQAANYEFHRYTIDKMQKPNPQLSLNFTES